MKPIIYISGPMTGYKDYNFPAFEAAKKYLQSIAPDAEVISPHELNPGCTYRVECILNDLHVMAEKKINIIYLLDGWEDSVGARMERELAGIMAAFPLTEHTAKEIQDALLYLLDLIRQKC